MTFFTGRERNPFVDAFIAKRGSSVSTSRNSGEERLKMVMQQGPSVRVLSMKAMFSFCVLLTFVLWQSPSISAAPLGTRQSASSLLALNQVTQPPQATNRGKSGVQRKRTRTVQSQRSRAGGAFEEELIKRPELTEEMRELPLIRDFSFSKSQTEALGR